MAEKLRDDEKEVVEEEKYTGNHLEGEESEEKTISYYSMGSGVEAGVRVSAQLRESNEGNSVLRSGMNLTRSEIKGCQKDDHQQDSL